MKPYGELDPERVIQLEHSSISIHAHPISACKNEYCTVHNRSDHSMREFPQHWRSDRGIMERICTHGVGHPDPDEINEDRVHGCDGCCGGEREIVTLHGELVDTVKWTLCDFYQAQPPLGDSNVEYAFAEKIVSLVREQIAKEIEADHRPMTRQTYGSTFEACQCGYMSYPCQLGARAAAIAKGEKLCTEN